MIRIESRSESAKKISLLLLNIAKAVRTFGFGWASVLLALFLMRNGFSTAEVGAIICASLLEDAAIVSACSFAAMRFGYCNLLMLSSLVLFGGGLLIAIGQIKWLIAVAVIFGTVSPAGYEAGAFAALEQVLIPELVPTKDLAAAFSKYNLAGFAGAAVGALCGGLFLNSTLAGVGAQMFFYMYAGIGLLLFHVYVAVKFVGRQALPVRVTEPVVNAAAVSAPKGGSVDAIKAALQAAGLTKSDAEAVTAAATVAAGEKRRDWNNIGWLAGLQGLDSFGGGFVAQTFISLWFVTRFNSSPQFVGTVLCIANILAATSFLLAPLVAKRFGLLRTMVFTHLPCSLALCVMPFMPSEQWAAAVLLSRSLFSSMDIPMRQAFAMVLVSTEMRPQAAAMTTAVRAITQALGPMVSGASMLNAGGLFFLAGGAIKSLYDALVFARFSNTPLQSTDEQVAKKALASAFASVAKAETREKSESNDMSEKSEASDMSEKSELGAPSEPQEINRELVLAGRK